MNTNIGFRLVLWLFVVFNRTNAQLGALSPTNMMGMAGGRFLNAAFHGAFLYEPWPRHHSQLALGCYSAVPGEFESNEFKADEKHMHTLVAKKDEFIPFELCWRHCTYRVGNSNRNRNDFVGITGDQKLCVCMNHVLQYQLRVAENSCKRPCTGVQGEFCRENSMMVYLVCYPGFYGPPFCDAQCPSGICVRGEFPGSQFEDFHISACRTNGDCFERCIGSVDTKCYKHSERCSIINGGHASDNILQPHTYSEQHDKHDIMFDTSMVVLTSRHLTPSPHEGSTHHHSFVDSVIAYHRNRGGAYFFTTHVTQRKNNHHAYFKINYLGHLPEPGYTNTDIFMFHEGMEDPVGGKLVQWTSDSEEKDSIGVLLPMGTNTSADSYLVVRHYGESNDYSTWAYGFPGFVNDLSSSVIYSSLVGLNLVEPGSDFYDNENYVRLSDGKYENGLSISIMATESYQCTDLCFQHRCTCDGKCLYGCRPGLMGLNCQLPCPLGHYGLECRYPCSPGCKDQKCHEITGECTLGCITDGITGIYCTEACLPGTYGKNCKEQCSSHCKDPQKCSNIDGTCEGGCEDGYKKPSCTEQCEDQFYGPDCKKPCGDCKDNAPCDKVTGVCPGEECEEGKDVVGPNCLCPLNTWGEDCKEKCGACGEGFVCEGEYGRCVPDQGDDGSESAADESDKQKEKKKKKMACKVDVENREVCGNDKETKESCKAKDCCWDDKTNGTDIYCFYKETVRDVPEYVWCQADDGYEYAVNNYRKKYADAKEYCEKEGAHLLVLRSEEHAISILTMAEDQCDDEGGLIAKKFWIGLTKVENLWQWVDGSDVTWEKWYKEQPENGNAVKVRACSEKKAFKWKAVNVNEKTKANAGTICQRTANGGLSSNHQCVFPPVPDEGSDATNATAPDDEDEEEDGFDDCAVEDLVEHEGNLICLPGRNETRPSPTGVEDPYTSNCENETLQSPDCRCDLGFWGKDCDKDCGECAALQCYQEDGSCGKAGCTSGYVEPYCKDRCPAGTYGQDCLDECGECLGDIACDPITGYCEACKEGFALPKCTTCAEKHYGEKCEKECGNCLGNEPCESETGYCNEGCEPGFEEPFCKCPIGFYGYPDCKGICGHCKDGKGCEPENGACFDCSAGYTGEFCNKTCEVNFYGEGCKYTCGNCANFTGCYTIDGACPYGCAGGFREPDCHCPVRTFGPYCEPCAHCIGGSTCDPETGECKLGCEPGFSTPDCKCEFGTWGEDCKNPCGHCFDGQPCNAATGMCENGCGTGYTGLMCDEPCLWGTHGMNCSEKCGDCEGCDTCDPVTGFCPNGCKPGLWQPFCTKECPDRSWGYNCRELCGSCVNAQPCRKSDGKCLNGCLSAYQPPTCKDPCNFGFYGANCLTACGHCADSELYPCNRIDGTCPFGCEFGYKPPLCVEEIELDEMEDYDWNGGFMKSCPSGMYGEKCDRPCGSCLGNRCDPSNGLCLDGCTAGYRPMYCIMPCRDGYFGLNCAHKCGHCFDKKEVCRKTDGLCRSGCQPGWLGRNCIFNDQEKFSGLMLRASASITRLTLPKFFSLLLMYFIVA